MCILKTLLHAAMHQVKRPTQPFVWLQGQQLVYQVSCYCWNIIWKGEFPVCYLRPWCNKVTALLGAGAASRADTAV